MSFFNDTDGNVFSVKLLPFLKINLLLLPVIAASLIFGYSATFALSYACALLHELTHIVTAARLGVSISYVELQPFGICARLKSDIIKNPAAEIAIAVAGPLSNLMLAAFVYSLCRIKSFGNLYTEYFIFCNAAIAAINLVPALPLDGGRILRAALTLRIGALRAYNMTIKFSRIPIALIAALSVYTLLSSSFNFSLILIGAFLLGNLFIEQSNISRHSMRELLSYKTKLDGCDMTRTTVITAHTSTPARKILKKLSYSSYHIIHVVNDDLRVVNTLTEGQLLDALTNRGICVTLGEL